MDEVIEAMGAAFCDVFSGGNALFIDEMPNPAIYREALTAAYNALRAKLVPVMYAVEEEGHPIISYITREKPTEQATSVTPLYALPEIDNG